MRPNLAKRPATSVIHVNFYFGSAFSADYLFLLLFDQRAVALIISLSLSKIKGTSPPLAFPFISQFFLVPIITNKQDFSSLLSS